MGAAGMVAALAGRPSSRWYALGLAAAATLTANPAAVTEPGWQLSFPAVIALLAGAAALTEALRRRGVPRAAAEVVSLTTLATVATAPLLAHHFGELSLASLPANLLAAPAVAPLMWLGMLAAAVAQVDVSLAEPLTMVNGRLVAYVEWVAHTAARAPLATAAVRLSWPLGSRIVAAQGGREVRLGALELRLLWPPPPPPGATSGGDPNERAVVARASSGSFDVLLPADAESDVLSRLELTPDDALKVSHHGSDDAGLPALLERLHPSVAAIEVGRGNSYGHPTVERVSARATGAAPPLSLASYIAASAATSSSEAA